MTPVMVDPQGVGMSKEKIKDTLDTAERKSKRAKWGGRIGFVAAGAAIFLLMGWTPEAAYAGLALIVGLLCGEAMGYAAWLKKNAEHTIADALLDDIMAKIISGAQPHVVRRHGPPGDVSREQEDEDEDSPVDATHVNAPFAAPPEPGLRRNEDEDEDEEDDGAGFLH